MDGAYSGLGGLCGGNPFPYVRSSVGRLFLLRALSSSLDKGHCGEGSAGGGREIAWPITDGLTGLFGVVGVIGLGEFWVASSCGKPASTLSLACLIEPPFR